MHNNEVLVFLQQAGLEKHARWVLALGFDDLDTLLHISDNDMKELGMPPSDIAKLRAALHEHRGCDADDAPNPVVTFLREVGMDQYAKVLLDNGFDEMETLAEISDEDMKALGFPRGHAIKLHLKLRDRLGEAPAAPEPAPAPTPQLCRALSSASRCSGRSAVVGGPSPRPTLMTAAPPARRTGGGVEASWSKIEKLGAFVVGDLIQRNIASLAPEAEVLFRPPGSFPPGVSPAFQSIMMRNFMAKFVKYVGSTATNRYDYTRLVHRLMSLGAEQAKGATSDCHFEALGLVLDATLSTLLGAMYTTDVRSAWMTAYKFMASIMNEGLKEARKQATTANHAPTPAQVTRPTRVKFADAKVAETKIADEHSGQQALLWKMSTSGA